MDRSFFLGLCGSIGNQIHMINTSSYCTTFHQAASSKHHPLLPISANDFEKMIALMLGMSFVYVLDKSKNLFPMKMVIFVQELK